MVISVVVQVEAPDDVMFHIDCDVICVLYTFTDSLSGKLLHLNVVEFPKVGEPLDELGGIVLIELDVWEEGL